MTPYLANGAMSGGVWNGRLVQIVPPITSYRNDFISTCSIDHNSRHIQNSNNLNIIMTF